MKGRMELDAVYHEEAFIDIMKVLGKYKITDCCLSIKTHITEDKNDM